MIYQETHAAFPQTTLQHRFGSVRACRLQNSFIFASVHGLQPMVWSECQNGLTTKSFALVAWPA